MAGGNKVTHITRFLSFSPFAPPPRLLSPTTEPEHDDDDDDDEHDDSLSSPPLPTPGQSEQVLGPTTTTRIYEPYR